MKKFVTVFSALILTAATILSFSSCGKSDDADKTIVVGASPTPHAEILEQVKDKLAEEGYTLEVKVYNDYVMPNTATESGELDANYFQHINYLNNFNKENNTHLVNVAALHYEPFAIFAGKTDSLDKLQKGAVVAVPNDTTNEARALLLLESQGLIKLKEGVVIAATKLDIIENPLELDIKEVEAAQTVLSLQDVDIAVINGNYAIGGGLKVADALAVEDANSSAIKDEYANIIAVKEGNENSEKIKALIDALESDEVREYINTQYKGAVVPLF